MIGIKRFRSCQHFHDYFNMHRSLWHIKEANKLVIEPLFSDLHDCLMIKSIGDGIKAIDETTKSHQSEHHTSQGTRLYLDSLDLSHNI